MTMSNNKRCTTGKHPADEWENVPEGVVEEAVYNKTVGKMDLSKAGLYSTSKTGRKNFNKDTFKRRFRKQRKVKKGVESLPAKAKMDLNIINNCTNQLNRIVGDLNTVITKLCSEEYLLEIAIKIAEKEKQNKEKASKERKCTEHQNHHSCDRCLRSFCVNMPCV